MPKKLSVLFLPKLDDNPYQSLLVEGLKEAGVDVLFGPWSHHFAVSKAVRQNWKPDILHLHWKHFFLLGNTLRESLYKSITFIGELIVLKILGIRFVWTAHNLLSHSRRYVALDKFFSTIIAHLADRIITHCETAKGEVAKTFAVDEKKIEVIPHGNYITYYQNTIDRVQARNQIGISTDDIVFLFLGLIRPYKGVFDLINTFNEIDHPHMKLVIAGKPHRNIKVQDLNIEIQSNPNIIARLQYLPDDEIQIYLNASDVVVLPFKDILTSGSLILAMSFGKAVIAPKIGCIPDTIDEKGGLLYEPSNPQGLESAMKRALEIDLVKMGNHNLNCATRWQWSEIGQKIYDLYLDCF